MQTNSLHHARTPLHTTSHTWAEETHPDILRYQSIYEQQEDRHIFPPPSTASPTPHHQPMTKLLVVSRVE